jgi:hypothetical protein
MVEKQRAMTIQQRLGFMDSDLKLPKHDEIMLWLHDNLISACSQVLNISREMTWKPEYLQKVRGGIQNALAAQKENCETRIKEARHNYEQWRAGGGPYAPARMQQEIDSIQNFTARLVTLSAIPDFDPIWPECQGLDIIDSVWEKPVMSGKYTVGFIDLQAECATTPAIYIPQDATNWDGTPKFAFIKEFEKSGVLGLPVPTYGFAHTKTINFEVKAAIPSLGEVIRQIRLYQEYEQGKYVIVSPDARWATMLKEQGIGFFTYLPGEHIG